MKRRREKHRRRKFSHVRSCEECGAREGLLDCRIDAWGKPDYIYCADHAFQKGFCTGCGLFCSGMNRFDFGPGQGLCDTCWDEVKHDMSDEFDDVDPEYRFDVMEVP